MMIRFFFLFIFILNVSLLHGVDHSFHYVRTSQFNESGVFDIGLVQRFYGDFFTSQALGAKDGMDFSVDTSCVLTQDRSFYFFYNSQYNEVSYGLSQYLFEFKDVFSSLYLDYFSFERDSGSYSGMMLAYSLERYFFQSKLLSVLNIFYNHDSSQVNLGLSFSYNITKKFSFIYEHIFSNHVYSDQSLYVYGLRSSFWGYDFIFSLQNSSDTGLYQVLNGVDQTQDLFFGIKIQKEFNVSQFVRETSYQKDYRRYLNDVK